jgi:anti-sigma28 factor (negative regulator of flagellin synthesis)
MRISDHAGIKWILKGYSDKRSGHLPPAKWVQDRLDISRATRDHETGQSMAMSLSHAVREYMSYDQYGVSNKSTAGDFEITESKHNSTSRESDVSGSDKSDNDERRRRLDEVKKKVESGEYLDSELMKKVASKILDRFGMKRD